MVLNVSSLLKTVKAVEDEHTRGTRAMEAAADAITQEIRVNIHSIHSFCSIQNVSQQQSLTHSLIPILPSHHMINIKKCIYRL